MKKKEAVLISDVFTSSDSQMTPQNFREQLFCNNVNRNPLMVKLRLKEVERRQTLQDCDRVRASREFLPAKQS